jgi:nucleotide-binding universal stress UspA family protein
MIALKNILVPTDFSECSVAAVRQGSVLAAAFDASLHLLHIATAPFSEPWAGYTPGAEFVHIVRRLDAEGRQQLETMARSTGLRAEQVVLATAWGDPADEILKYAREHAVDLVVCGTHGRRGFDRLIMGSVAERVLRLAPCPVLTVHGSPAVARQTLTRPVEAVGVR